MRTIQNLLAEYGESHQNETNKLIHWICVPAIFFSVVGLLYCVKFPLHIFNVQLNLAMVVMLILLVYYVKLSITLSIGMFVFCLICLLLAHFVENSNTVSLWLFCVIVFVAAWIGQFYGHKIEGKKPSFLKDVQFLMIGPAWLMHFVYNKMGIKV
jgi:uncharacterized membrane protein YGL010W